MWGPLGLRQRIEHAQLLAPEDLGRFAALGVACSVQFSHAPSDRDLADEYWAGKTERRLRVPLAARLRRGRRERQRRADRGARPARGDQSRRAPHDRRPARLASRAGADRRLRRSTRRVSRPRGSHATSGAAARCSRATTPTSSCSTATRGTTSTRRSSRRWSAAAGCTTRRPGTARGTMFPSRARFFAAANVRRLGLRGQSPAPAQSAPRQPESDSRQRTRFTSFRLRRPELANLVRLESDSGFACALRTRDLQLPLRGNGQVVHLHTRPLAHQEVRP